MFRIPRVLAALMFLLGTLHAEPSRAEDLTLAVHPVLPPDETFEIYQPLADYLSKTTGHNVQLATTSNFLVHWQLMRRGIYHLVLDGAQFTDYRVKKMGYTVLAKMPAEISYTLVAHEDLMILEPGELVGKSVATLPSPSLGALRLAQMFPHPLRQPRLIDADNAELAFAKVQEGTAAAAIVPAPMVGRFSGLTTVATTEQVPAPGISASPAVSPQVQAQIKQALLAAEGSPSAQPMLRALNIGAFEPADHTTFDGYDLLLEGVWGY